MLSIFDSIPNQYKTQEMRDSIFPEYLFSKRYVLDQYKTNEMCDKAVDYCLATLKLVPDCLLQVKRLK